MTFWDYISGMGLCMAATLIGVNISFMVHLGSRLMPWFRIKICAVTTLLLYVGWSMYVGNPDPERAMLGFFALALDMVAVMLMWISINKASRIGLYGLVPVLKNGRSNKDNSGGYQ